MEKEYDPNAHKQIGAPRDRERSGGRHSADRQGVVLVRSNARRRSKVLMPLCLTLALGGAAPLLAATGAVRGKVTPSTGTLSKGTVVKVTHLPGNSYTLRVPIQPDGTYAIPQLAQGEYRFDVLDPSNKVIGSTKSMVNPGTDNVISLQCTPRAVAPAGRGVSKGARWGWIGGGVGAVAIVAAANGGTDHKCDRDISPAKPGRQ